jgi:gamma-glutamyltranspeptidase/glutathione hydrolase
MSPCHARRGHLVAVAMVAMAAAWLGNLLHGSPAARGAEPHTARGQRGMVVSVSEPATQVGVSILRRGGNAVDAAIAVALALAVTHPEAGNIGGGGFMMVCPAPGQVPMCIEYRETAPAAATATMFSLDDSPLGHRTVGVPGTVRGLALAHERYGSLSWRELVEPAVALARDGFVVSDDLARSLNRVLQDKASAEFEELRRVFAPPAERPWKPGDRLVQPELAATLQRLADGGAEEFYSGRTAQLLVEEIRRGGGLVTHDDLRSYRANVRPAVHGTYRGYDVYGPPPPSSGGTCLVLMLHMLEPLELRQYGRWSPQTVHFMVEAMRRAYAQRARYLGDPAFARIPEHLTSKAFAAELAGGIDPQRATPSDSLLGEIELAGEGESTTHFAVIDAQGMAVSNTYTLEHSYGGRVVVRGAGFLLNNEMTDFNWKPGHTDRSGRIGTPANTIAPGKRMLSSQTPTIVMRDGRVVLLTGSPGGRTIINTVLQMVLGTLEFDMDLPAATAAPRLHHQWLPDAIRFEGRGAQEYQELVRQLEAMGHRFDDAPHRQGDTHSIWVDRHDGSFLGVADFRRGGRAAGW